MDASIPSYATAALCERRRAGENDSLLPAFEYRTSRIFAESIERLSNMLGYDRVSGWHHQEAS